MTDEKCVQMKTRQLILSLQQEEFAINKYSSGADTVRIDGLVLVSLDTRRTEKKQDIGTAIFLGITY